MRNIFLVSKFEVLSNLEKRSFWIMTFLFPAAIIALNVGMQVYTSRTLDSMDPLIPRGESLIIGYVDQAGLLLSLPSDVPPQLLRSFPDEASAQAVLQAGELDSYYIIPSGYLQDGELILVDRNFRILGNTNEQLVEYIINFNLTGEEQLASHLNAPLASLDSRRLAPHTGNEADNPLTYYVPFATMFIFFFLITMSSGFMLQSVSKEKENRTAEVLLLSLRPRDLMLGKVLGLSLIALFQMLIWAGGGLLVLERGRQALQEAASFRLPPGFIVWALLFFLFGFLMYASLMAALGALAPSAREGGQFTFILLLPMMIPLWLNPVLTGSPNSPLATFLGLFPLTAPVSMMTRLAAGSIPPWQPLASLLLLALTTYLIALAAARFFRAEILLSSSSLSLPRLISEWRR